MKLPLHPIIKCCIAAAMISPLAAASGDDAGKNAMLRVPTVTGPYTLDGKLDEPFWQTLPEQSGFQAMSGSGDKLEAELNTSFRIALSGETLLLGIVCQQRQEEISLLTTRRNDPTVCADDSVEVFLTTGDADGHYQFAVNTGGYLFDQWVSHTPVEESKLWNGVWEAGVHIEPTQWSVEVAIPLAALNHTTAASLPWRLNVARTLPGSRIYQSWAPVDRGFGEWKKHPLITFADEVRLPAAQSKLVVPPLYPGTLRDEGIISLPAAADRTYTLKSSLREWQPGPLPPRHILARHLTAKNGELRFPLDFKIPQGKQLSELIIAVIDETDARPVTLLSHTFYPPKLLEVTTPWSVCFDSDGEIQLSASVNATAEGKKKGELRLAVINSEGKTILEEVVQLSAKEIYPFRLPLSKLLPDLYKIEITLHSEDAGEDQWTGRIQVVYGPFSKKSLSPRQAALSLTDHTTQQ